MTSANNPTGLTTGDHPRLNIDTMAIQLPPGMEHRANGIARGVIDALGRLPLQTSLHLERLSIPALSLDASVPDAVIAAHIARAIHGQLLSHAGAERGEPC